MRDIKIGNLKRVMGNTENGSSQPAMRVKRRGEKSLAGLTADPAFKPKLGIFFSEEHFSSSHLYSQLRHDSS